MSMRHRRPICHLPPTRQRLLAALVLLFAGHAWAYDSVTFGVQLAPPTLGAVALTANVVVPVATLRDASGTPVGVALRGDVSYAVGAGLGPSAGVNLLLSDAGEDPIVRPYLGAGVALASAAEGWSAFAPSAYAVVGWRAPLSGALGVRVEGLVNVTLRSAALQLGFDVAPWGAE